MRQVFCQKCQSNISYNSATLQELTIACPKCGSQIPVLDSQVITITDGSMQGPGVHHLNDKEQDLVVQGGKALLVKDNNITDSESVIEARAATSPYIQVSPPTLNPLQNPTLGTVEEKIEVEVKTKKNTKPVAPATPVVNSRYSLKPVSPQSSHTPTNKKLILQKKQFHRWLIRGIIVLVIIDILIILAVVCFH